MRYRADLHIHSRFSIATSKNATLEGYHHWARIKGLDVIATGDFTHPAWIKEIESKLLPLGDTGFFRLRDKSPDVLFCLGSEISCIYSPPEEKREYYARKTYKVHLLVFVSNIDAARYIALKLSKIGNIGADGRPILKISPRNLLEIVLESGKDSFLIPAHIWTPWFSLFGAKSGFDSVEEAFEDLAGYIFALETGLSSDPEMNWLVGKLDKYTLVSNSDAHSPEKLGREANVFDVDLSYHSMFNAIKTRRGFIGTIEYFPEEGKYFYDGHRKCGVFMSPKEAEKHKGICPVCGKPLTFGVLHRVKVLADREKSLKPNGALDFVHIFPLKELISLVKKRGVSSMIVRNEYDNILNSFGTELGFLLEVPIEDIEKHLGEEYASVIAKMRRDELKIIPGFDGQFGKVVLE